MRKTSKYLYLEPSRYRINEDWPYDQESSHFDREK